MMLMKTTRTRKRRRITTQFWSLLLLLEACSTALQLMNELREVWVSGHPRPGRRNIISLTKLWDFNMISILNFNIRSIKGCHFLTHKICIIIRIRFQKKNGSIVPHHWGLKLGSKSSKVPCQGVGYRLRLKCAEISIRNPITKVVISGLEAPTRLFT